MLNREEIQQGLYSFVVEPRRGEHVLVTFRRLMKLALKRCAKETGLDEASMFLLHYPPLQAKDGRLRFDFAVGPQLNGLGAPLDTAQQKPAEFHQKGPTLTNEERERRERNLAKRERRRLRFKARGGRDAARRSDRLPGARDAEGFSGAPAERAERGTALPETARSSGPSEGVVKNNRT